LGYSHPRFVEEMFLSTWATSQ